MRAFCSWSGGKDSALALLEAQEAGARPELLLTMLTEVGLRSRSHGLARELVEAQAAALGLGVAFASATWDGYERAFAGLVGEAVDAGVRHGVFGDIDVDAHRAWVERVCGGAGAEAAFPLWQRDRRQVLRDVLERGFEVVLVAVRDGVLPPELLGARLDGELLRELERHGVDLAGENGEYHTCVVDGPLFARRVEVVAGERSLRDGVWFVDLAAAETAATAG